MTDKLTDTPATIWTDRFIKRELLPAGELAKRFNILNPRAHPEAQRDATESSLDTVGWIDEISLSTNGPGPASLADNPDAVMFDGHERVELALVRGGEGALVPVSWYQLSVEETDFALLVKDPTTEMAETKPKELAALLERTRTMTVDPRLGAMLERLRVEAGINGNGSVPPEPSAPTEIEAERLAKQYGVNLNQVWSLGWHKLAVGDCEDLELRDRLFGDNRPRYGMHDPPYGINVVGSAADSGGAKGFGKIGFTGVTPVNYYAPVLGDDKPFNPAHLLEFCPDSILWGANYYADKLPSKKGWIVWDKKGREDWRDNFSDCELAWSSLPITTRIYRHVWMGMVQEGEREQRVHPTQKPTALFEKIMSELFVQDGIIADFYLGSGPTLLACERLNRTCYGFELSPNYAATIIQRWEALTGLKAACVSSCL